MTAYISLLASAAQPIYHTLFKVMLQIYWS